MKKCSGCKLEKIQNDYYKNKSTKDGLQGYCKVCFENSKLKHKERNREKNNAIKRKYVKNNPEKAKKYRRISKIRNRLKNNATSRIYEKNKYHNDPVFKLKKKMRVSIRRYKKYIQQGKFHISLNKAIGCSVEDLKKHLESQFYNHPITNEPMTWENSGYYGWHIDHITPLDDFDLTDPNNVLKANNYCNLQPMWYDDHKLKTRKDNKKEIYET